MKLQGKFSLPYMYLNLVLLLKISKNGKNGKYDEKQFSIENIFRNQSKMVQIFFYMETMILIVSSRGSFSWTQSVFLRKWLKWCINEKFESVLLKSLALPYPSPHILPLLILYPMVKKCSCEKYTLSPANHIKYCSRTIYSIGQDGVITGGNRYYLHDFPVYCQHRPCYQIHDILVFLAP